MLVKLEFVGVSPLGKLEVVGVVSFRREPRKSDHGFSYSDPVIRPQTKHFSEILSSKPFYLHFDDQTILFRIWIRPQTKYFSGIPSSKPFYLHFDDQTILSKVVIRPQIKHFSGILSSKLFYLHFDDQSAVLAWYLSETNPEIVITKHLTPPQIRIVKLDLSVDA